MKQIFQGLIAMQLQTTWQEIFEFRETHTGNIFLIHLIITKIKNLAIKNHSNILSGCILQRI